jgi:RNA polymerase sigma factor (sigma-70 family)
VYRSSSNVLPEDFDNLLTWLDPDRERAGQKYETIRQQLIKMFAWQRCPDPEKLADETITRVIHGVSEIRASYVGDPSRYFYRIATNLVLEKSGDLSAREDSALVNEAQQDESEEQYHCLNKCLLALTPDNRELILAYYASSKQAKTNAREMLANQLGLSPATLRIRVHRIRTTLEKCLENCMKLTSKH